MTGAQEDRATARRTRGKPRRHLIKISGAPEKKGKDVTEKKLMDMRTNFMNISQPRFVYYDTRYSQKANSKAPQ